MQVGDKVWLKPTERQRNYKEPQEYIISKIGRRYIEVKREINDNFSIKFDMENNYRHVSNYSPDWKLYFSLQDIVDENESYKLANEIRNALGDYGIPNRLDLNQLRRIMDVINEK